MRKMRTEGVHKWRSIGFASLGDVDFRLQADALAILQSSQASSIRSASSYWNKILHELKRFDVVNAGAAIKESNQRPDFKNGFQLDDSLPLSTTSSSEDFFKEPEPPVLEEKPSSGSDALLNLGLQTGLSLLFSLLQQNWRSGDPLSASVLATAGNILASLPPLSLLQVPPLGQTALESVSSFLQSSAQSIPSAASPCVELLLSLAVQRGRCSDLLHWINASLCLHSPQSVSTENFNKAVSLIHGVPLEEGPSLPLKDAALHLTEQIVNFTSKKKDDVYVWGSGSSFPSKWSNVQDAEVIETGLSSTYVVHSDGSVSCWNDKGSSDLHFPGPIADISVSKEGDAFVLALTRDGKVYSWGNGSHGRLGHGDKKDYSHPKEISSLPPVAAISAGYNHAAAVSVDGCLYTWGEGSLGRLGHKDGIVHFVPTVVKGLSNVGSVSCGAQHTLVLSKDGRQVWSFGCGNSGELGHGDSGCVYIPKLIPFFDGIGIKKVIASNRFSIALGIAGVLWTWGKTPWNTSSSVPKWMNSLSSVKDVATGGLHVTALLENKSVYCWGLNVHGNCGFGLPNTKVKQPKRLDIFDIDQISAGVSKSFAWTIYREKSSFNWPYSQEPDAKTFSQVSQILSNFGLCEDSHHLDEEDRQKFLLNIFTLLSSYFETSAALIQRLDWNAEKIALEDTLFQFLDKKPLSDEIYAQVIKCIQVGTPFLQPPLRERVKRCYRLLKLNNLTEGQTYKLKMDLESLESPAVISKLITDNLDSKESVDKLLRHLVNKMHHDFVGTLSDRQSEMMSLEMTVGYSMHMQYLTTLEKLKEFKDLRQYVNEVFSLGESLIETFCRSGLFDVGLDRIQGHQFIAVFESTLLFLIKNPPYIPKNIRKLREMSLKVNCLLNDPSSFLMDIHVYVSILSSSVIGSKILYFKPADCSVLLMCSQAFFNQLAPNPSIYRSRHSISNYFEEVKNVVCSELPPLGPETLNPLQSLAKYHFTGSQLDSILVMFSYDYVESVQNLLLELEGAQVSNTNVKILHSTLYRAFAKMAYEAGASQDDFQPLICSLLDTLLQFINVEESVELNIDNYWKLFFVALLLNVLEYSSESPSEDNFSNLVIEFKAMVPIILQTDCPSIEDILSFFESIHLHKKKLLDNISIAENILSEVYSVDLEHGFHEAAIQIVGELLSVGPVCTLELQDPLNQSNKTYFSSRYNSNRDCLGSKLAELVQLSAERPEKINDLQDILGLMVCCLSVEVYNLERVDYILCKDFLNSLRDILSNGVSLSLRSCILRLVFQSVLVARNVDKRLLNESSCEKISLIIQDQLKDSFEHYDIVSDIVNFISILTSAIHQSVPSYLYHFKFSYWINGLLECLEGRPDIVELSAIRSLGKILSSFDIGRNFEGIVRRLFSYIYSSTWNSKELTHELPTTNKPLCTTMEFNLENSYHCILQDSKTIVSSGELLGYCMANRCVSNGLFYWSVSILKDSKGVDGISIGLSPGAVNNRSTKDMWVYMSSGQLAHRDQTYTAHLPSFSKGDVIACILNKDDCSLCFSKNGGPSYMAFCDLPRSVELYPVIAFNSTKAKVSISNLYELRPDSSAFYWTEPHLSSLGVASAQESVDILRTLYNGQSPVWRSAIDAYAHSLVSKSEKRVIDLVNNFTNVIDEPEDLLALVDDLLKDLYSILALMSDVDSGLRLGSRVCYKDSEYGIIVGMSWAESLNVKVRWCKDGSIAYRSIHCLRVIENLDPSILNRVFKNKYSSELIDLLLRLYTFSEKLNLSTFSVYSSKEESPRNLTSTSEAVELMTDSLVNSIIDEVTGKHESNQKGKVAGKEDCKNKQCASQYEAFFKIIALQFSSIKTLISLALNFEPNGLNPLYNNIHFSKVVSAIERMSLPSYNISLSRNIDVKEIERTFSFLNVFRSNLSMSGKIGSIPFPNMDNSLPLSSSELESTINSSNASSSNFSNIWSYPSSRRSSLDDTVLNFAASGVPSGRRTFRSDLLRVNPNIFLIDHLKGIFEDDEDREKEISAEDLTWLGPIGVKEDPLGQYVFKLGSNDPLGSSIVEFPESINNKLYLQYANFVSYNAKLEEMFYSLEYLKKIIQLKCTQDLLLAFYQNLGQVSLSSILDISFCYPFLFEFARMNGLNAPLEGFFFQTNKELRMKSGSEIEVLKVIMHQAKSDVSSFTTLSNICIKNLRNLSGGDHALTQNERVAIYITQILTEMTVSILYDSRTEISGHLTTHFPCSDETSPKHSSNSSCSSTSAYVQSTQSIVATKVMDALSSVVLSRRFSDLDSITSFKTWSIKLMVKIIGSHLPLVNSKLCKNHSDILGSLSHGLTSFQMKGHTHKIVSMASFKGTLATGSCDGTIRLWKNDECKQILILDLQEEISVMSDQILSWSPSGRYLVLAIGNILNIWGMKEEDYHQIPQLSPISMLCWSSNPEKEVLLAARQNGTITAVSPSLLQTKELDPLYRNMVQICCLETLTQPDLSFIISYSDGIIRQFSIDELEVMVLKEYTVFKKKSIHVQGDYFALYSSDEKGLRIMEADNEFLYLDSTSETGSITTLSWSPGSVYVAVGHDSGDILVVPLDEAKESKTLFGSQPVSHLSFHTNDPNILVSGSSKNPSGFVNIWSLLSETVIRTLIGSGGVTCLEWVHLKSLAVGFNNSENVTVITLPLEMDNIIIASGCRSAILGHLPYEQFAPYFKTFINKFGNFIIEQYEYERLCITEGFQLVYTQFLQNLSFLAYVFNLNSILRSLPETRWKWLFNFTQSMTLLRLLNQRNPEADHELLRLLLPDMEDGSSSQGGVAWTPQADSYLMKWYTDNPSDWQPGGKSSVYLFGNGLNGQLAELGSSSVQPKLVDSFGGSSSVVCGLDVTFALQPNGSLFACGDGSHGKLGLGNSEDYVSLTPVSALRGFVVTQVATSVLGGSGHTLAVTQSGEVFSWGDGEDGKLGHGNSERCRRPKIISSLSGNFATFVAVGTSHSAVLTDKGRIFTFGFGDRGRLGHGNLQTKKVPEVISSLREYFVTYVACGLEHTLCVSRHNDMVHVWSFGDGDHGKLGNGLGCSKSVPKKINYHWKDPIVKVALGKTFSLFLTSGGDVFFCGSYRHSRNSNTPKKIPQFLDIVDIAVGGEDHILALSSSGQVWGWGLNCCGEGELAKDPSIIPDMSDRGIRQISAGRSHYALWTAPPILKSSGGEEGQSQTALRHSNIGCPSAIPNEFQLFLPTQSMELCLRRLTLLHQIYNFISEVWRLFPVIDMDFSWPPRIADFHLAMRDDAVRESLSPLVATLPLMQTLMATMTNSNVLRNYGPQVTVRRLFPIGSSSIFSQIAEQVYYIDPQELRLPYRSWKVKLVGEAADDAGGVFDDTITEMCLEVSKEALNLLIPTPNGLSDTGGNRDKFILNSGKRSKTDLRHFWFLGILCGVALRTRKPIAISLAPIVWKLILEVKITWKDLEDVDLLYARSLDYVASTHSESDEEASSLFPMEYFTGISFTGEEVPLYPGSQNICLTNENKDDYVKAAFDQRCNEMMPQVLAMRMGLSSLAPYPILKLLPSQTLESLICGEPSFPLWILKKIARYRDLDPCSEIIVWLWEILEEFSNDLKILFLIFVSGRSRLPTQAFDVSQRFQILRVQRPENGLPTAQTCFFQLRLPPYTSKEVMRTKLIYAIKHCRTIDMDNYMLTRNNEVRHI